MNSVRITGMVPVSGWDSGWHRIWDCQERLEHLDGEINKHDDGNIGEEQGSDSEVKVILNVRDWNTAGTGALGAKVWWILYT